MDETKMTDQRTDDWANSFQIVEDHDDIPANRSGAPSLEQLIEQRLSRRGVLTAALAAAASATIPPSLFACAPAPKSGAGGAAGNPGSTLTFAEISNTITPDHRVSPGYIADPLIRWGDPVTEPAGPAFDPRRLSARDQSTQFGYNCDFIAFMPLPRGSNNSDRGLLCVNHEYTCGWLMWSGMPKPDDAPMALTPEQVEIDMAAHGHSVVEIRLREGRWEVVPGSAYNRRVTGGSPGVRIAGPAAGHPRLQTEADPTGTRTVGTINNCAGGVTPWGTVLIAEENFNKYFVGTTDGPEARNLERYGFDSPEYDWRSVEERFDVGKHPTEPNRFGWVVELDPYDPDSVPVKRTSLGRFKHEGSTTVIDARTKRLAVYMGDDQRFEYVYKFVSDRAVSADPQANRDALDEGTLYVAKLDAEGGLEWLPLVFGQGPLTEANGFGSQADVLIETRRAADLLGATPMDRPEDVEPNPTSGKVYVMLTNNTKRTPAQIDAANPRAENVAGHIIELIPPGAAEGRGEQADHVATNGRWEMFLRAGDPGDEDAGAVYHPDVSRDGWLLCPDNCAFDNKGRLWIATDQGSLQGKSGVADGIRATDTAGDGRALTKMFYACPTGAEMCGPCFTPDGTTMFVAVQHPGDDAGSTFDAPSTRWPASEDSGMPPRPSVVAIRREDGGEIGG